MEKIVFIDGMKCEGCANRVKNILKDVKGIKKVNVELENKKAILTIKKDIDDLKVKSLIESLGFKVVGIE